MCRHGGLEGARTMHDRPGVYVITCVPNGKRYVGSAAKSIAARFRQHRYRLRRGDHHSPQLQAAWNKYGEKAFHWGARDFCSPQDVLIREQRLIDALQPEFNTVPLAGNTLGFRFTTAQRKALKDRPQSQATKYLVRGEYLSVSEMACKYSVLQVTIRQRLRAGMSGDDLVSEPKAMGAQTYFVRGQWLTRRQIAEMAGLPPMTIYTRIASGWLGDDLLKPRVRRARNSRD